MMNIYRNTLAVCCLLLSVSAWAQLPPSPGRIGAFIDNPVINETVCPGTVVNLSANFGIVRESTSYDVVEFNYTPYPFDQGTLVGGGVNTTDDRWSNAIPLPFTFCFYGVNYNQCMIGSNGIVSFTLNTTGNNAVGGFCPFNIGLNTPIPSATYPVNFIGCPYMDINPALINYSNTPNAGIRYATYGTAPNRAFVVSFYQIPIYACSTSITTSQIAIYETTNIIETIIYSNIYCINSTSQGRGIHGIQNANGTQAAFVPGRNAVTISAGTPQGYAFVPSGAPAYNITWTANGVPITSTENGMVSSIIDFPSSTTTYHTYLNYTACGANTFIEDSVVISTVASNTALAANMSSTPETCIDNGTASTTFPINTNSILTYSWENSIGAAVGGNTSSLSGLNTDTYSVTISDTGGCSATGTVQVGLDLPSLNVTPATATVCPGGTVQLDATYNSSNASTVCGLGGTCTGTPNTFQVGQGTTSLQTLDGTPFNQFFKGSKVQYLFTAAELQAAGLRRGVISALDFEVLTKNSTAPFTGMNVSLGCTSLTALGSTFETGLTNVYTGNWTTALGWNSFPISSYSWDGNSSLIVEVCFTNPGFSFADFVSGSSTPFVSSLSSENDVNPGCGLPAIRSASKRPNVRFANCGVLTYAWTATTDLSSTTIANPVATPTQATQTYTVVANDGNCPLVGTVVVNISGGLSAPTDAGCSVITYNGLTFNWNTVANATAYEVSVDGGATWIAPNGSNGISHSVTGLPSNTAVSIIVRATGGNGCPNTETTITCVTSECFTATTAFTAVSCFGNNNGTITATTNVTDNYTFELQTPVGTVLAIGVDTQAFTFNTVSSGTYNVSILNNITLCRTVVPVTVTEPASQIVLATSSTPVSCFGQNTGALNVTAAGGTTPYSYNWSSSLPSIPNPTSVVTGSYRVTVTDANGCQDYATVTVGSPAAALMATATHADVACNGASTGRVGVTVSGGTGALSFNWIPGNINTALVDNIPAGVYAVTVTDDNGCTASATTTVIEGTPVNVTITTVAQPCADAENGILSASATGGDGQSYSYEWSNVPASGSYNSNIGDGTYNVIASDFNGCTASASATLVDIPLPVINIVFENDLVNDTTIYTGVNYAIQGNVSSTPEVGVNYTWIYNSPLVVNPENQYAAFVNSPNAATSQVVVLNAERNGCSVKDTISLSFLPPVLRMPNAFTPGADTYNPIFKPAITGAISNITFSVFDRWGHVVHEEVVSSGTQLVGWDGRYKSNDLPRDIYIWRVIYQEPDKPAATIKGGDVTLLW